MLFPTFDFLLFVIPVMVGYWLLADRPWMRVVLLLVASYFFYMASPKTDPPPAPWYFAGLLVFSTVLDYVCGHAIHRLSGHAPDDRGAKALRTFWMAVSLVGNLGLLAYFKYVNFFVEAFTDVAALFGISVAPFHLDVILPLGISFYTFQTLSYTIDVYRGKLTPERSFLRFALFVVFFPQLVAGPIVRANEFLPQLHRGPVFSREGIESGAFRVMKGIGKKMILGDYIAVHLTDRIFDTPSTYTSLELLIALYAYTLQLYADFSGYSDVAIGIAKMLGFEIPENFDRPYQARDVAEYWRRWHMTLSSWLRDYLYFPLLSRFGPGAGSYLALWLTMIIVGMWHGASWNFVIYSNVHAAAMLFNRWHRRRRRDAPLGRRLALWTFGLFVGFFVAWWVFEWVMLLSREQSLVLSAISLVFFVFLSWLPITGGKLNAALHVFLTFQFVSVSRIFFRAPDLATAREYFAGLVAFDLRGVRPGLVEPWVYVALALGIAYHFTPKRWVDEVACGIVCKLPGVVLGIVFLAFSYFLMRLLEGAPRAFIYFQF